VRDNYATIVVRADGVQVIPGARKVRPVAEEFKLGIEWPERHAWDSVTVGDFRRVRDNSEVEIQAPLQFLPRDGNAVQSVEFKDIETRNDFSNYKVTCSKAKLTPHVETFTVELLSIYGEAPPARHEPRGKAR
jgi:hypothetical protein